MTELLLDTRDLESLSEAAKSKSDEVIGWFRGLEMAERAELKDAVADFDKVIKTQPGHADAWLYRGWIRTNLEEFKEAVEDLERSIGLNPDNARAWTVLGTAKRNLERYEESIEDFDMAIRMNPKDAFAWAGRGRAKGFLRQYREAFKDYDKAIGLKPGFAGFWGQRGNLKVHFWMERVDGNSESRNNRESVLLLREAARDLNRKLELAPKDAGSWLLLGGVEYMLESRGEAGKCWEKAKSLFERQEDRGGVDKAVALLKKLNDMGR